MQSCKGAFNRKESLIKAMQRHQIVHMMYREKSGAVTKRGVKIINITGESFTAFYFTRQEGCTFLINNILAMLPILQRESKVIKDIFYIDVECFYME